MGWTQLVRDTLCTTMHAKRTYEEKKTRKEQVHLKEKKQSGETTQKAQFQFAVLSNAQERFLYKPKKRPKKGSSKSNLIKLKKQKKYMKKGKGSTELTVLSQST